MCVLHVKIVFETNQPTKQVPRPTVACTTLANSPLEEMRDMLRRDLRQRDGKVLGLMVQQHYAKRFILDSKEDRKSMEIRSKPVKFLNEGDKVALVSTNHGADRQVLAILEYQGCSKIKKADFHKYFQLHRVTLQEIEQFKFFGKI